MKYEYMRFVRWEGEHALFKKANVVDKIAAAIGLSLLCRVFKIKEGMRIIIRVPKYINEEKKNPLPTSNEGT